MLVALASVTAAARASDATSRSLFGARAMRSKHRLEFGSRRRRSRSRRHRHKDSACRALIPLRLEHDLAKGKLKGELFAEPESALRVRWANWHKDFSDKQAWPLGPRKFDSTDRL